MSIKDIQIRELVDVASSLGDIEVKLHNLMITLGGNSPEAAKRVFKNAIYGVKEAQGQITRFAKVIAQDKVYLIVTPDNKAKKATLEEAMKLVDRVEEVE